jgi:hypothetical protein
MMTDDHDKWIAMDMAWELQHLAPMELGLRPQTVLQLVGLLQLANRHPGVSPELRGTIAGFLTAAREYFATCPAVLDVIRRGDDRAEDRS